MRPNRLRDSTISVVRRIRGSLYENSVVGVLNVESVGGSGRKQVRETTTNFPDLREGIGEMFWGGGLCTMLRVRQRH